MDTFTKRDNLSITKHMTVSRVYKYEDLRREKEALVTRRNSLDLEIEENDYLLSQCERLGIEK